MASIRTSAVGFLRGIWGAILSSFAAITDPLGIAKVTGLVSPETQWVIGETAMRYVFVAIAFVWAFVWYHGVRKQMERGTLDGNMPLHVACRWIARDSSWAASYPKQFDSEWPLEVHDELMSKLLMGHVEVFGRKRETQHLKGPLQYITPADKSRVQWSYQKLVMDESPTHMWIPGDGIYYTVKLDRDQVKRVWPRRSLWQRLTRRSPVERLGGYADVFARQDAYYRDNFGFSPTPMRVLLESAK